MDRSTLRPSASYSFTVRLTYPNQVGMFARIAQIISQNGGDLGAVDIVSAENGTMTRDITVQARDQSHVDQIVGAINELEGIKVVNLSDRVFLLHLGGKIAIRNKVPITTRDNLSMAYTPGVARVCLAIAKDKAKVRQLTIKSNSVAVISDGSAVLGLGDIGPEAAMPVMEGKAMLFKEFADIDAYPICLTARDPDEIVNTIANMAVGFGGINLEDISAPRCFAVEEKLQVRLDIPVFHDDQHGTAVVVLAGLLNSLKLIHRQLSEVKTVICGAGAAGMAITKMLLKGGAREIVVCDRGGILEPRRSDLNPSKQWLATNTNPRHEKGRLADALKGAQIFIGVSGPGLVDSNTIGLMAPNAIVFALANPNPEIMPEEVAGHALVVATGRSDYPNQINNVLAFPGIFRGALNVRARRITEEMKLAAAHAIATCISPAELSPEYIVPSVFNRGVVQRVAAAVQAAAAQGGVSGKTSSRVTP